ncbi:hypothetical protein [Vibrio europaeus]|uniref:hypothetical protein n=1 Tax=Vibrio europaeus TaxID=300876 RepID=UPI00148E7844|nr:hypothetical protein [Vibrio europaeus]NOH23533.1 hypothetical protein [Vibrio europaeus]
MNQFFSFMGFIAITWFLITVISFIRCRNKVWAMHFLAAMDDGKSTEEANFMAAYMVKKDNTVPWGVHQAAVENLSYEIVGLAKSLGFRKL